MKTRRTRSDGFTIVELIVVIVVIAFLVTITIFAFGDWRTRTAKTEVRNELTAVASAMKNERTFNNAYPTGIPSSYKTNSNVTVTYRSGTASNYCIDAVSVSVPSVVMKVTDSGQVVSGSC